MIGKIIAHPIAAVSTVVAAGAGISQADYLQDFVDNNIDLNQLTSLFGENKSASEPVKPRVSCFNKEQVLPNNQKQGVNVCFVGGLEEISYSYYGITSNGVTVDELLDVEGFKIYLNLIDTTAKTVNAGQSFLEEKAENEEENQNKKDSKVGEFSEVRGVSENQSLYWLSLDQKIKEEIVKDLAQEDK